ncbi:hypothetical protein VST7929_01352 [Vibrio stylophorae]|uniref:DUF3634 family protein n=1 Tax=Vibrio stylophorae TaxID=659351 RepID=A0ABN8DTX4_9VIBR|nr:DUF3634 family protein [Vibrio stylophorae]CAH0533482.1 hypothetical protein VST7929_01352 [Vibrio stylophorae]
MIWYVLIATLVIFGYLLYDRPVLKLTYRDGQRVGIKGSDYAGFVKDCDAIAEKKPFSGVVRVYRTRVNIKLAFSKGISSQMRQRIHNVFPFPSSNNKQKKRRA